MRTLAIAAALGLLLATAAGAGESQLIEGRIVSRADSSVTIADQASQYTVALDAATYVTAQSETVTADMLRVGQRVQVSFYEAAQGPVALVVEITESPLVVGSAPAR
jgi:hypothetical protein